MKTMSLLKFFDGARPGQKKSLAMTKNNKKRKNMRQNVSKEPFKISGSPIEVGYSMTSRKTRCCVTKTLIVVLMMVLTFRMKKATPIVLCCLVVCLTRIAINKS